MSNVAYKTKKEIKKWLDDNVWDGEDRSGCKGDFVNLDPDELQELVEELIGDMCSTIATDTDVMSSSNCTDLVIIPKSQLVKIESSRISLHEIVEDLGVTSTDPVFSRFIDATSKLWEVANKKYKQYD